MSERLDRIEEILARTAVRQEANTRDIDTLVESVSNLDVAIEAAAAAGRATDERLDRLTTLIANNAQQIAESNQQFNTVVARIDENNQRFNILLEEARADRAEWRARFDSQHE